MKRFMGVIAAVAVMVALAGAAGAFMGPGGRMMGMGPGQAMGPGQMANQGGGACPGMAGTTGTEGVTPITEEKARALAQEYADKYLKGFTAEKVLPFAGRFHTMYSVELKGPNDEIRVLHVNPFGNVMPFGGPWRRGA